MGVLHCQMEMQTPGMGGLRSLPGGAEWDLGYTCLAPQSGSGSQDLGSRSFRASLERHREGAPLTGGTPKKMASERSGWVFPQAPEQLVHVEGHRGQ